MLLRGIALVIAFLLSKQGMAIAPEESIKCLKNRELIELSANYLAVLTAMPSPPFVAVSNLGANRYVSSSELFAEILDVSPKSLILNDLSELRFMSHTLPGTSILLVIKSASDWNLEKSRKVKSVAKLLKISISLIWLDESFIPKSLSDLIDDVQGRIWRLPDLTKAVMDKTCYQVNE